MQAVNDVSFEVFAGEIFAVIGPNGSGKTSIMECLEGLRRQTEGTAHVFGFPPHHARNRVYSKMGVQLQNVQYPDKIKVSELCKLFASFYEAPVDWRLLLEQLGLAAKKGKYVCQLSGGEKQRLSILLALLPKPRLLILDELTTGLDPEVRRGLWASLKVIRKNGTGILLVSHYMDEVEMLADRILFMLRGKSIFIGSPEELKLYAKQTLPEHSGSSEMSMEDVYLSLVSPKESIHLEALL